MTNNPCCSLLLSSMVPGSRNPMWGEEFDFYTEELPVQVFGNQPLRGIRCSNYLSVGRHTHFDFRHSEVRKSGLSVCT
jgi:hypothetical protein